MKKVAELWAMKLTSRLIARLVGTQLWLAPVAILSIFPSALVEAAEDSKSIVYRAAELYRSGRIDESIGTLSGYLGEPNSDRLVGDDLAVGRMLLTLCSRAMDLPCLQQWAVPMAQALREVPTSEPIQERALEFESAYYFSLLALGDESKEAAKNILERALQPTTEMDVNPPVFVRRKLIESQLQLRLDERALALRAVNQALAVALSTSNPQDVPWDISTAILDSLSALIVLGEVERAAGLAIAAGNYLASAFPQTTPEYVRYRLLESQLLLELGNGPAALASSRMARESLQQLSLSDMSRAIFTWEVLVHHATASMLAGDLQGAADTIAELEELWPLGESVNPDAWAWPGQVVLLSEKALVLKALGKSLSSRELSLLAKKAVFPEQAAFGDLYEVFREIALLIAVSSGEIDTSNVDYQSIANKYVGWIRRRARYEFDVLPRPGQIDRLVANILLSLLARDQKQYDSFDLVIPLADVATRSERSFVSEAQALLTLAENEDQRRLLHQGLRLSSRRNKFEQLELRRLIGDQAAPTSGQAIWRVDYDRLTTFKEFDRSLSGIVDYFEEHAPRVNRDPLVSGTADLQRVLGTHEALAWSVPVFGSGVINICVRNNQGVVRLSQLDIPARSADLRILQLALTAPGGPDLARDRQFPAEASVRIYDAFYAPIQNCLDGAALVFVATDLGQVGVPAATLLRSLPPRSEDGYDLASGDWLVRHFAISYVKTPSAIVAPRSGLVRRKETPYKLLGVGDPVLEGVTASGESRREVVTRGSVRLVGEGIGWLPALPETRDELITSAQYVGEPSRLLLGEDASEAALRGEPLSLYQYLSFATHGLIREDLPGLSEAAIVLTPKSSEDSFDDGLLSASEVADLPLNADFVALSACNTANFDLNQFAADVPGLATAFAIAGAPSMLATLWPVDSSTSRRVVEGLFRSLADSSDVAPAQALAWAQRRLLDQAVNSPQAHPRFWGPFVVFGDRPVSAKPSTDQRIMVGQVRKLTGLGGEILGIATNESGAIIASGLGDWTGDRAEATVVNVNSRLEHQWKTNRADIGGSAVVLSLPNGVLSAGYHWGGEADPRAIPVFFLMNHAGRIVGEKRLDFPGISAFPTAVVPHGRDSAIVILSGEVVAESSPKRQRMLFLYSVTPSFDVEKRAEIAIEPGTGPVSVRAAKNAAGYLIAASDPLFRPGEIAGDGIMFATPCSYQSQAWVKRLGNDFSVVEEWSLSGVGISSVSGHGSRVFLVGAVNDCDKTHMAAWRVEGGTIEMVFKHDSPISSSGGAVTVLSNGNLLMTGSTKRIVDFDRAEDRQRRLKDPADFRLGTVSFSTRTVEDLIVVYLEDSYRVLDMTVVTFGGDSTLKAGASFDNRAIFGGMIAGRGALVSVEVESARESVH